MCAFSESFLMGLIFGPSFGVSWTSQSWRQQVVKSFWLPLQSSVGGWSLFCSETINSQAAVGFMLTTSFFNLSWEISSTSKETTLSFISFVPNISWIFKLFHCSDSSLLDKAPCGRGPTRPTLSVWLSSFDFPSFIYVKDQLSQSQLILFCSFLQNGKFHLKDLMVESQHLPKSNRNFKTKHGFFQLYWHIINQNSNGIFLSCPNICKNSTSFLILSISRAFMEFHVCQPPLEITRQSK